MITILISTLIGIGFLALLAHPAALLILLIWVAYGFSLAYLLIGENLPHKWNLIREKKLIAIKDSPKNKKNLFLACDVIGSSLYYVFYYKDRSGATRFDKIRAGSNVSIIERKRKNAVIKEYEYKFEKNRHYLWGLHFENKKYEIIVPKGAAPTRLGLSPR